MIKLFFISVTKKTWIIAFELCLWLLKIILQVFLPNQFAKVYPEHIITVDIKLVSILLENLWCEHNRAIQSGSYLSIYLIICIMKFGMDFTVIWYIPLASNLFFILII